GRRGRFSPVGVARAGRGDDNRAMGALQIAFLVDRFPVVTETFILAQITGLLDRGYPVEIVARSPAPPGPVPPEVHERDLLRRTVQVGIPLRRLGRIAKILCGLPVLLVRRPGVVWRIGARYLRDRTTPAIDALYFARALAGTGARYDVVHAQFGPLGSIAAVLRDAGVLGGKLVTSFRGYDLSLHVQQYGRDVYRHLLDRGDLFLAASDVFRARLVTELGADPRKVVVHRSGIDLAPFAPPACPDRTRSATHVLTVGRLVEKKGVEYALRALARVLPDHPDVTYAVIGDGPLRPRLQALARDLPLADRVVFLGERTHAEVREQLARAALLVAPSVTAASGDEEGIPNVLKEAMAMGLPVISTRHAGIPELVEDGVAGFLVPERDVEMLAARIGELVADPERARAMGRAGQLHVRRHYDARGLNDELVDLYNRLF
ncbi:MAG: glycosyltransferase, partial [Planctomycetes bacterium]|nr:glycosyltransferase [Planctomycetota bacterium]